MNRQQVKDSGDRRGASSSSRHQDSRSEKKQSNLKRKLNTTDDEPSNKRSNDVVAEHYNQLPESGLKHRTRSKIYFMRNFNNWVKSVLLKTYQYRLRDEGQRERLTALDLGCGKGGDLLKWSKGYIKKLVCTDLAATSIDQCRDRYLGNKNHARGKIFDCEFIVNDSSLDLLSDKFSDPEMLFDLVSSQFVVHYAFESEVQADRMIQNACERLRKGGYFIGTTVNAMELHKRLEHSQADSFGNDIYRVTFGSKDEFKDFGHKYNFHLDGVVDCPEYVAKREVLEKLAEKYGMKLVMWKTFSDFFATHSRSPDNKDLLKRIKALEFFPSRNLQSQIPGDYDHATEVCKDIQKNRPGSNPRLGTLSATEWDAASLYVAFAFKKVESDETFDVPVSDRDSIPVLVMSV